MTAVKDVVVFLPGILGSVLENEAGDKVWSTSIGALWTAIKTGGHSIESLELNAAGDPGGIRATELIDGLSLIPLLGKTKGYEGLERYMTRELGLVRGQNFFSFPYDWRLDNRIHARRLEQQALGWLHDWKQSSGAQDAKLVLIGHSMGGLVSRYFLEVLGGWAFTRTLITLGTPHRGSLNAVDYLLNGMKTRIGPVGVDINPVLRSLPSIYQLLPTYSCVLTSSGEHVQVADAARDGLLTNVDAMRAQDANSFHREIYTAQKANAQNEEYRLHGYNMIPMVGGLHPTLQSVDCSGDEPTLQRSLKQEDAMGDGTVPRISATPIEFIDKGSELYLAQKHANLQNDKLLADNISGLLTQPDYNLDDFRSARGDYTFDLSVDMDDVFLDGAPLTVRARPGEGNPVISVVLRHVDGQQVFEERLTSDRQSGWYTGEFDLGEGLWEVEVLARGAQTVNDMAVVANT